MALPNIINDINDLQNQINTIKSTYLPKSGGTMTGSITNTHNKGIIATNSSHMDVGYDYNQATGGLIALRSVNYTGNPGGFEIFARSSSVTKTLNGKTDGTLTWGGSVIHTDATYSGVSFLKCNETLSYGWNGLQYFNKTMSVSEDPTQNVSPTADWYHVIRMNHANGNGYYVDLAACFHNDRLYTRRVASGSCATGWNEIPVLVYSWKSGTQWYRKYSDGWIEQGGQTPRTSDNYISISFPIAFAQDNPNVQLTRRFYYDNDTTSPQNRTTGVSSVTKTGFKCYDNGWSGNGYGSAGVWYACGY